MTSIWPKKSKAEPAAVEWLAGASLPASLACSPVAFVEGAGYPNPAKSPGSEFDGTAYDYDKMVKPSSLGFSCSF